MKRFKFKDISLNSDLSRIFRKEESLNLYSRFDLKYSYKQDYLSILDDKYEHLTSYISKEIQDDFDRQFISKVKYSPIDYLDVLDLSERDSVIKLFHFLNYHQFDFIIVSSKLTKHFFQNEFFKPLESGKISRDIFYYGKLIDRIDFFGHHTQNDEDLIICGKRKGFFYNFYLDFAETDETEQECKIKLTYYLDSYINQTDFLNLYFVTDRNPKYTNFLREKSIGDILN